MKILILTLSLVGVFNSRSYAASPLFCQGHGEPQYAIPSQATQWAYPLIIGGDDSWLDLKCSNKKGEQFTVQIAGFGIGYQRQFSQYYVISCPLVRKSKLTTTTFYGVNASASVVAGAGVSLLSNENAGVCVMTGFNLGIGAAVSFDQMNIYKD